MSFITKRERVFNDYELFDLPARNEGKLKAYGSCTDTRAWSHFSSDKTENLVEVIKRNNEKCAPKYVPTKVIVETLMVNKNVEIARLKRKIGQFQQMIAVYDQLDLSNDQKNEIEKAHDAIKAASSDLDNMFLDLDVSGFTEGIDSEAFETGKSRADESQNIITGDHWSFDDKESKIIQTDLTSGDRSDKCTYVVDSRICEMQETIICKDAKLNAMRNTIAVMENDVCEPFCIYAQIYTAIERIIGILYQHDKYKEYLDLLMSGADVRHLDIKGKICYKMKVLEKFCLALIAPCTRDYYRPTDCKCYHADIVTRIETTYALTGSDTFPQAAPIDIKRTQLVADIMEQTDMKDILSNSSQEDDAVETCDSIVICLDNENLRRLKQLQKNYEDLIQCYETVKHERICLQLRCAKYNELEYELESLRVQLSEYNNLWNEKEHHKKRSECMDELKEKYFLLYEESANLDTQLKAESEINEIKSRTIADLRNDNIELEKKLNEATIMFEKGQNTLQCKLKEAECKCMCYEEQVKSLSSQIDRLLEQEQMQPEKDNQNCVLLINEIEMLKEQSKHLQDLLVVSDEEKQRLHAQFRDNLNNINDLKMEIENWKSELGECRNQYTHLENYLETLQEENRGLKHDLKEKSSAVKNLLEVITTKNLEIDMLTRTIENVQVKNNDLVKQLNETQLSYTCSITALEGEAMYSLQLAKKESASKIKDNEELLKKLNDMTQVLEDQASKATKTDEENRQLREEIRRISGMNEEKSSVIVELDKEKKKNEILQNELIRNSKLAQEYQNLKQSHESNVDQKTALENEIHSLQNELQRIKLSFEVKTEESEELKKTVENIKKTNETLESDKENKLNAIEKRLMQTLNENANLKNQLELIPKLEQKLEELNNTLNGILDEKTHLKNKLEDTINELNDLHDTANNKIIENETLKNEIKSLKLHRSETLLSLESVMKKNHNVEEALESLKEVNRNAMESLKVYENVQLELDETIQTLNERNVEKDSLLKEIALLKSDLRNCEKENYELNFKSTELISHNEALEKTLINTRKEIETPAPSEDICTNLFMEIQEIKQENVKNHNTIHELCDKLEEQEKEKIFLLHDLQEREDKIVIQQNHINELELELRKLHESLNVAVDVSEEFKENAHQKIDLSLKKMEAHQSKAIHNLKMDMAVLQNHNILLEDQLSTTKLETEQTLKDKSNQTSELQQLKNERKIIVTEIKELELISAGDTNLSPHNCSIEELLISLHKIRLYLHKTTTESSDLEKRLLKVQSSSQLLLNKTEEAKKLIEKEKYKILEEKEEAIHDRKCLENKLNELKFTLEKEKSTDIKIIKDLESELLNQKLIITNINKSSQIYVSKLEEEMKNLQSSYEDRIVELQSKLDDLSEREKYRDKDFDENKKLIEKVNNALKEKLNEVSILQDQLDKIKSKCYLSQETQTITNLEKNIENKLVQTDNKYELESELSLKDGNNKKYFDDDYSNMMKIKPNIEKKHNNLISENDVQILSVQVKPKVFKNNQTITLNDPNFEKTEFQSTSFPKEGSDQNNLNIIEDNNTTLTQHIENIPSRSESLKNTNSNIYLQNQDNTVNSNKTQKNYNAHKTSLTNILLEENKSNKPHKAATNKLFSNEFKNQETDQKEANTPQNLIYDDSYAIFIDEDKRITSQTQGIKIDKSFATTSAEIDFPEQTFDNSLSFTIKRNNIKDKNISVETSQISLDKDVIYIIKSDSSVHLMSDRKKDNKDKLQSKPSNKNKSESKSLNPDKFKRKPIKDKSQKVPNKAVLSFPQKTSHLKPNTILNNKTTNNDNQYPINQNNSRLKTTSLNQNDTEYNRNNPLDNINNLKIGSQRTEGFLSLSSIVDTKIAVNKMDSNSTFKSISEPNISAASVSIPKLLRKNITVPDKKSFKNDLSGKIEKGKTKSSEKKNNVHSDVKNSSDLNKNFKTEDTSKKQRFSKDFAKTSKGVSDNISTKNIDDNLKDSTNQIIQHGSIKEMESNKKTDQKMDLGMKYILETIKNEFKPSYKSNSFENIFFEDDTTTFSKDPIKTNKTSSTVITRYTQTEEKKVTENYGPIVEYEKRIEYLTRALENSKRDSKKVIEEIKLQYDNNIRNMMIQHDQGVRNMQGLHEETLHDILNVRDSEVENLRSMSIEALKKLDKMEKGKQLLNNTNSSNNILPNSNYPRGRRSPEKTLTKSIVQALDVTPKALRNGPCTCTVGSNLSDIVRKIFEQVDGEKRKLAEQAYLKYICKKFLNNNNIELAESVKKMVARIPARLDSGMVHNLTALLQKIKVQLALDAQELSFLHFKVCRAWKHKVEIEEVLQKKIDTLESEVMAKQRNALEYIAELDRRVIKEKNRLQEVREAVGINSEYSTGLSPSTQQKLNTTEDLHLDRLQFEGRSNYSSSYVKLLSEKEENSIGDRSNTASIGLKQTNSIDEAVFPLIAGVPENMASPPNAASISMFEMTSNCLDIDLTKYGRSQDIVIQACYCNDPKHGTDKIALTDTTVVNGRRMRRMKTEKDRLHSNRRHQTVVGNLQDHEIIGEAHADRRSKRAKSVNEKSIVLTHMEENPDRRGYTDELPTRLRRVHDTAMTRGARTTKK